MAGRGTGLTRSTRLSLERGLAAGTWMPLTHSLHTPLGSPLSPAPSYVEGSPCPVASAVGRDLLFVLQKAGLQGLPDPVWPQPQPKAEHVRTGSPQDRHRKDTSCLPACWPPKGQAASELPTGSRLRALAANPVGERRREGTPALSTRAARGRECEPAGVQWVDGVLPQRHVQVLALCR